MVDLQYKGVCDTIGQILIKSKELHEVVCVKEFDERKLKIQKPDFEVYSNTKRFNNVENL